MRPICLGGGTDDEVHVIHEVWVASLADAGDLPVADTHVGLVDAGVVDDDRTGDDHVYDLGVLRTKLRCRDTHPVAQDLAATVLALLAMHGVVLLDASIEVGIAQADGIALRRAEELGVLYVVHIESHGVPPFLPAKPADGPCRPDSR